MSRYIPQYFTIDELTRSTTATKRGIRNIPGSREVENLMLLIEHVLDPIRRKWGGPITISSGYRCQKLNTLVGGSKTSSHMNGQAADMTVGGKDANWRLYTMLKESNIPFTKLIFEHNTSGIYWVHVSYVKDSKVHICYIYDPAHKVYQLDK